MSTRSDMSKEWPPIGSPACRDVVRESAFAGPAGYAPLVNALREAVLRLEEWGPGPADAFWINEVAKPLIAKYSKPNEKGQQ